MRARWPILALLPAALAVLPARPAGPPAGRPALPPAPARRVDFVRDVQPILKAMCVRCHGPKKSRGGLRLDVGARVLRAGVILPGRAARSPLVRRVAGLGPEKRMPPAGPALSAKQVGLLRAWVDQGAHWPAVADAGAKVSDHWAYRPLRKPAVPAVKDRAWVRTPVDAFVLAALEARGLKPSAPADRRTLLRRVSFDLIGLPPTPEEVDAFLHDRRPDAYERVVDRLLASPHYGERWARHWLDVIHFAETHGHDQDVPRENAWPYRDYLISSFNSDKPYGRFAEEQLAGDVLYPDDPQGVVATGLLAAGPWDESSQQSIRDDTVDKKVAQYLDRDDMVTTVMSTLASTTIHCARCHDHKFDPISQDEYYSLQAVFAGVDRANRPYDPDPPVHRTRQVLLKRQRALESPAALRDPALLSPGVQARVAEWEKARAEGRGCWVVLDPSAFRSEKGAKLTRLADGSLLSGGPCPPADTYTVEAHTDLRHITAVRLEVLTDDSLPHKGPGRQDNGNLHLNEFKVQAAPKSNPSAKKPLAVRSARADFDQAGWTAAMAVDGNPKTAWGIYPEVGKPHRAVFELKEPAGFDGGTTLAFTLEQTHGGGHLIGRLRLAVSADVRPSLLAPPAGAVAKLLAVPPGRRSAAQKAQLALHVLREDVEEQLACLPAPRMVYAAANDFKPVENFKPARGCRPVSVLRRGDIHQPVARARPGALGCVPGLPARFELADPADEGQRRAALAKWVSDPRNVLTWRSIVNRVWHYHFGRGIVSTPNDLGKMGARPSHPELLDWLAVEFRDDARGSLKKLHRLIVTSAAYRQSSGHNPEYAKVDADNLLLWRMNRARLDAECVRDAVLRVSGKLDPAMGGPSVKQFVQGKGIHVTPKVDYGAFDVDSPGSYRRSVYRFVFRTLPDPFMDALDCPDASQFAPVRSNAVTAQQALALLNDRFMVRQSEHFAARVREAGPGVEARVRRAYLLALGREPSARELGLLARYAARHGMANACRLILNCNEFMFVD